MVIGMFLAVLYAIMIFLLIRAVLLIMVAKGKLERMSFARYEGIFFRSIGLKKKAEQNRYRVLEPLDYKMMVLKYELREVIFSLFKL